MNSGVSYLGGKLGLGNQVSTQFFCLYHWAESILMAYERIKSGQANRMLAGSTRHGPYIWEFDALRVCTLNTMKAQSKVQDL
jgi:hypothetical protein